MKRAKIVLLMILCLSLIIVGCSNNSSKSSSAKKEKENENEKVTLTVYPISVGISEEDFNKLFVEPVKKEYPNIEMELVQPTEEVGLEQLIAAGKTPDMTLIWNGAMPSINERYELFQDISSLAEQHKMDLDRFEPVVLDSIRDVSDKGELYGLPFAVQLNALYYNKDIFDKLGVPYPNDGMTWDEVIELAKKVTVERDGTKYKGLDPEHLERISFPLSIVPVDEKTGKASVDNDLWKQVFETANSIYSINGNGKDVDESFFDQQVAMFAGLNIFNTLTNLDFNWDVAQYPSYEGHPNTYGMVDTHVLTVNNTTKHPDAAMKAISVLTSDEVQLKSVKETLRGTPLKDSDIQNAFGEDNPALEDKHISSVFKSKPAPAPVFSRYNGTALEILNESFDEYLAGKKDVNTALREAGEAIDKMLLEQH